MKRNDIVISVIIGIIISIFILFGSFIILGVAGPMAWILFLADMMFAMIVFGGKDGTD